MSDSNVVHLRIPPKTRAANKLSRVHSSARFVAAIDALLDIRPRRTNPGGCEVLILEDHVFLASEASDGEFLGMADELIRNLNGIADVAELDAEERAALLQTVEEARLDEALAEAERMEREPRRKR
jgi:hypothetical protein